MTDHHTPDRIVIFDGFCNLCSWSVNFIINRDPQARFYFTASQTEYGKDLLKQFEAADHSGETVLLYKEGEIYSRSTAVLMIARELSSIWRFTWPLIYLPRSLRDVIYMWISRHRYQWFGRKEQCYLPGDSAKNRFL